MKLVKFIILVGLILLTSCNNSSQKSLIPEEIFKEELKNVYSLYEDKILLDNITETEVKNILDNMTSKGEYSELSIKCERVTQGVTRERGKRVVAFKLPVELSFIADEKNIKTFLKEIVLLENSITIGDIVIKENGENYLLDCSINFFGTSTEENTQNNLNTSTLNIEEISGKTIENDKIVLRDYNLILVLRPYNTDSATLSLGTAEDDTGESYVYYNYNNNIDLVINIINENNRYYCEYSDLNNKMIKSEIKLKDNKIIFDILSCPKESSKDMVGVNIKLLNKTDKKTDIQVFDDSDNRVSFSGNEGKVEVTN